MSFVTGMFKSSTLINGLLSKDPGQLTMTELDQLQHFVNKGRSMVLLDNHPQLEGIFSIHSLGADSRKILDILLCFLEEGGSIGSTGFRKMVDGMISKRMVTPAIVDVLERNRFLLPNPIQPANADGVLI